MKRVMAVIVSFVMALILPASTYAISEAQLDFFAQNNILFYDPNGVDCNYVGGLTSTNANYSGAEVFSSTQLQAIQTNRPIYEKAASQHNFPWQILAVLHNIEHSLQRSNPDNGQGVYQLYSYTAGGTNENRFEPGDIDEVEFERQTLIAAEIVSDKAGGMNLNEPDNVKKLFFIYNGASQEYIDKALAMGFTGEQANNGEGSAYVMNRFDARRDPTNAMMDPLWAGKYTSDGHYEAGATSNGFGAFVQYAALGGDGGMYCMGGQGLPIFQTAMNLAKLGTDNGTGNWIADKVPKAEYQIALNYYNAKTPCRGAGDCAPLGASCDQFVATVMIYSGADPDFPQINPPAQQRYMEDHPEKYQRVANVHDTSLLQPGDIFVADAGSSRHIFIYGGKIDGKDVQIGASYNQHTAYVYNFYNSWTYNGVEYNIFRKI